MIIKLFYYNCLIKIKVNNQINKYFNLKKQTKIIIPFFFFFTVKLTAIISPVHKFNKVDILL